MKYINRDEFEQLGGWHENASYQRSNFPEPCKRLPRVGKTNGSTTPVWSIEVAEAYIQSKVKLDLMEVKRLNDSGMTRKQMAEKLNTTPQKLRSFCRYNNILSLSTIKDKASRKNATPKIQTDMFPEARVLNTFEIFLHNFVVLTPSLRSRA